jgi:putative phosphonate transport system ATP-binding protein
MSALLQVRGLSHHYGQRIGCQDVSFDLHRRRIGLG